MHSTQSPLSPPVRRSCGIRTGIALLLLLCMVSCDSKSPNPTNLAGEALDPDKWIRVEEPTLGFRSQFPGKWKHRTEFMPMEKGAATVHIFEYWHIAFQYGITVVRFPPGVADMSDPERVLDYAVKSIVDENGGIVSHQEALQVGDYPARRAMISLPESYLKSARLNTLIVLREDLVYRISTSGVGNHDYIQYFLDAFTLTPIDY